MDHIATSTKPSTPVAIASDGGPDCERVNTVLEQLVEGQPVTAEDEDFLYHHGSDCSPCFDDIKKQHAFVYFLNQRVTRRPIPASLHRAIMASVLAETA